MTLTQAHQIAQRPQRHDEITDVDTAAAILSSEVQRLAIGLMNMARQIDDRFLALAGARTLKQFKRGTKKALARPCVADHHRRAVQMRAEGKRLWEIAEAIGVSSSRVTQILKRVGRIDEHARRNGAP